MEALGKLIEEGLTKEQYLALFGHVDQLCSEFMYVTNEELQTLLYRTHLLLVQNDWGELYTEDAIHEIYYTLAYNNVLSEQGYYDEGLYNTKLLQKIHHTVIKYYRDEQETSAFHVLQRMLINLRSLKYVRLYSNTQELESDAVWLVDDETLYYCLSEMDDEDFTYAPQLFDYAVGLANREGVFNDFFIQGLQHAQKITHDYIKQHTREESLDEG